MSSKNAARLKALEQARSKLRKLTKHDVISFTFIMSDEGPEMIGEESLTTEAMAVFEDQGLIDFAKRIRMRGNDLTHRSTLTMLKLEELTDYDLLRSLIYDVMKVEGLGTLWQPRGKIKAVCGDLGHCSLLFKSDPNAVYLPQNAVY